MEDIHARTKCATIIPSFANAPKYLPFGPLDTYPQVYNNLAMNKKVVSIAVGIGKYNPPTN